MDLSLAISDLARASEQLLKGGLQNPGPGTFALVFGAGLLTSLGPCSLSLLPVSLAYLAGFGTEDSVRHAAPIYHDYELAMGTSCTCLGERSQFVTCQSPSPCMYSISAQKVFERLQERYPL
ncbi:MAG: hypothetical protein EBR69_05520, partial [Synechococcaceae bacterium WB4_2_0805]|nr:hypothetical protein [Synechococcaceae bacterium WB4_2_0805]